jgi:hypothetical protein
MNGFPGTIGGLSEESPGNLGQESFNFQGVDV